MISNCSTLLVLMAALGAQPIPEWRLGETPLVAIGGEGSAITEFNRIVGVRRSSTGLIAVLNSGSSEIRIFDAQGKPLANFGRSGAGPGEFERMSQAGRAGDTLFLYDRSLRRLTRILLAAEPKLLGSLQLTADGGGEQYQPRGRLADGRWLAATGVTPTFDGPPGVRRLPGYVGVIPATGAGKVQLLAELPSGAVFVHNPTGNLQQASVGLIAFSPFHYAVASGGTAWFGDGGSDSLIRVLPGGGRRAVRLPLTPRAPSRELIAALRREEIERARDAGSRSYTEAKFSRHLPKTLPLYESLVTGFAGEVWVQEYAGLPAAAARYLVIGPDLKPRAWVEVPAGFRVSEAGIDYVAGVHQDADGVETVRVYALARR